MSAFQQLPLVLTAVGYKDENPDLVVSTLMGACESFDATRDSPTHLKVTRTLLDPRVASNLRADLEDFLMWNCSVESSDLAKWRMKLS